MLLIPFDPTLSANQSFRILLGGVNVSLRLSYNDRDSAWYMAAESDGGKALAGIKVVPKWPLLMEHEGLSPLTGDLFVFPLDDSATEPVQYAELGRTWGLFYATPSEVAGWAATYGL